MGKDTIVSGLLQRVPGLRLSRSWTTRPQRAGEDDDAYCFVDRERFERRIGDDGFLEWVEYLGNLYGTPVPEDADEAENDDLILVIDVEGASNVLRRVPGARMILVVPPSPEALGERMRARGDDEQHVGERVVRAVAEEEVGRRLAHDVIVNDDLDRAVGEMAGILEGYRAQPGH
ncbi:MAG: guanylate kinase [Actinomycetota bacterium]|nr:guanylate kinase [Actinomycetota bacterium]MDQ3680039.1 guanylate kinase [Actinomycetota bacterium]